MSNKEILIRTVMKIINAKIIVDVIIKNVHFIFQLKMILGATTNKHVNLVT